jgi:hypothetical protein
VHLPLMTLQTVRLWLLGSRSLHGQQIALGNFNVPEDIQADTECVSVNP